MKIFLSFLILIFSFSAEAKGSLQIQNRHLRTATSDVTLTAYHETVKLMGLTVQRTGKSLNHHYDKINARYGSRSNVYAVLGKNTDPDKALLQFDPPILIKAGQSFPLILTGLPTKGSVFADNETLKVVDIWSDTNQLYFDEKVPPKTQKETKSYKVPTLEIDRLDDDTFTMTSYVSPVEVNNVIFSGLPNDSFGIRLAYKLDGKRLETKNHTLYLGDVNIPLLGKVIVDPAEPIRFKIMLNGRAFDKQYLKIETVLSNASLGYINGVYQAHMDKEYLRANKQTPKVYETRIFEVKSNTQVEANTSANTTARDANSANITAKSAADKYKRHQLLMEAAQKPRSLFNDIQDSHPNHKAIKYLKDKNVIAGYEDGTFQPDRTVNRAELLKIIVASQNLDLPANQYHNCFPDVTTEWFAPFVCYAKKMGWVKGYPDGTFKPAQTVSKAESLKMLLEAYDYETNTPTSTPFEDVATDAWFAPYISAAKAHGLLEETAPLFEPAAGHRRAGVAENLYRLLTP